MNRAEKIEKAEAVAAKLEALIAARAIAKGGTGPGIGSLAEALGAVRAYRRAIEGTGSTPPSRTARVVR